MKKQFVTIVLILLLLISWIIILDLHARNQRLANALEIAEDSLDRIREEVGELSNQVDKLIRESGRTNEWNKAVEGIESVSWSVVFKDEI